MKLSVIIPCYNGAATLGVQLEALAAQSWDENWEVIFADNGSNDGSIEIVRSYERRIRNLRIVDASARRGQPYAMNTGVAEAAGEAVAFCDADDAVGEGWVAAMGEALMHHDLVASRFEFHKLNSPLIAATRNNQQSEGLQETNPPFLPHAGGSGLGVQRALHQAVGGFDEAFPALHDTDFCWRLQLRGSELYFAADAVLHVRFRETLPAICKQSWNYGEFRALLHKRYNTRGMRSSGGIRALKAWLRLALTLPKLGSKSGRIRWVRQLGRRGGCLAGSIKYRTFAL